MTPTLLRWLLFATGLFLLLVFVHVGILSLAFGKLGLPPGAVLAVLAASLIGSLVNIPLFTAEFALPAPPEQRFHEWLLGPRPTPAGRTVIAINLGGGVIPVLCALYLFGAEPLPLLPTLAGIGIVAALCYALSRPVPGLGITMPILIAPLAAALVGLLMLPEHSAALAYVSGTLGVLVGADLLHLRHIAALRAPVAAIGGAGTFDGVFMTGIISVLLA